MSAGTVGPEETSNLACRELRSSGGVRGRRRGKGGGLWYSDTSETLRRLVARAEMKQTQELDTRIGGLIVYTHEHTHTIDSIPVVALSVTSTLAILEAEAAERSAFYEEELPASSRSRGRPLPDFISRAGVESSLGIFYSCEIKSGSGLGTRLACSWCIIFEPTNLHDSKE